MISKPAFGYIHTRVAKSLAYSPKTFSHTTQLFVYFSVIRSFGGSFEIVAKSATLSVVEWYRERERETVEDPLVWSLQRKNLKRFKDYKFSGCWYTRNDQSLVIIYEFGPVKPKKERSLLEPLRFQDGNLANRIKYLMENFSTI